MSASIVVKDLCLDVPTFVQPNEGTKNGQSKSWVKTLTGAATGRSRREFRRLLDGVSFSVSDGDRIGLIGRNGAGKTTLLRVLTGAYVPTSGVLEVTGSRQALLNINLGFNHHATLIENIFLRGTAMGIAGRNIQCLIEPVLDFAQLKEKSHDRLHTLSSGQRMRLGFAIATAVSQDIIIMDEWLGAGDAAFVERAKERMDNKVSGSKIVVLASHNNNMLKQVCNKGLVMSQGRVDYFGDIDDALDVYKEQVKAAKQAKAS